MSPGRERAQLPPAVPVVTVASLLDAGSARTVWQDCGNFHVTGGEPEAWRAYGHAASRGCLQTQHAACNIKAGHEDLLAVTLFPKGSLGFLGAWSPAPLLL